MCTCRSRRLHTCTARKEYGVEVPARSKPGSQARPRNIACWTSRKHRCSGRTLRVRSHKHGSTHAITVCSYRPKQSHFNLQSPSFPCLLLSSTYAAGWNRTRSAKPNRPFYTTATFVTRTVYQLKVRCRLAPAETSALNSATPDLYNEDDSAKLCLCSMVVAAQTVMFLEAITPVTWRRSS